jgi:SAM-dependent methyltransferase
MLGYYEEYWTPAGVATRHQGRGDYGDLTPSLAALLDTYVPAEATCLDLGCGDGRTAGWLVRRGTRYIGVDVSRWALRGCGLPVAQVTDAGRLPVRSASVDRVACLEVLEHLLAPQEAVTEARRVLRPGGLLLVTVPNVAYWRRRAELALLGRWQPLGDYLSVEQPWRDPHLRFFTPGALRRLLEGAGFEDVTVGGHDGTLLGDVPGLRRLRGIEPRGLYGALERAVPSPFALRLHATARRA